MKKTVLLVALALALGACIVSPPPTYQAPPPPPVRSGGHFDYAEGVLRDLGYVYMGTQGDQKFYHAPETVSIAFGLDPDGDSVAAIADFTINDGLDGEDMANIQLDAFDALGIADAYFWLADQQDRLPPSGGSASGRCGRYFCYADMEDWVLIVQVSK